MLEKAQIQKANNKTIRVTLPEKTGIETSLVAATSAGAIALTVLDTTGFAATDYIQVGETGHEKTEIVAVSGVTNATTLAVAATSFTHSEDEPIYLMRYNQVRIYGAATSYDANAIGAVAPTQASALTVLDVKNGFNELVPTTEYDYYYARYYNLQTGDYSQYSTSAIATGLTAQCRGEIRRIFRQLFNEPISSLMPDDVLDDAINAWQRELYKKRRFWSVLRTKDQTNQTVQDQQRYVLPSNIADTETGQAIVHVKIGDQQELVYFDDKAFTNCTADHIGSTVKTAIGLADITVVLDSTSDFAATGSINIEGDTIYYTGNTEATGTLTGVTGITATHAVGKEAWQMWTSGQPTNYTIDSGYLKIFPIPDSANATYNIYFDYWKKPTDLTDDSSETAFPFITNCYLYLNWVACTRKKALMSEQLQNWGKFRNDLDDLILDDGEFRDVFMEPFAIYRAPY